MHKSHFSLNLSMLLVFTHIIFSVSYLIFTFSLNAFIKVAQGCNEKGDGVGFPVLSYKTNIYPLRCDLS